MSLDEQERPEDTVRRFAGYLVAVTELHAKRVRDVDGYTLCWCRECGQNWPCPTVLAANGEGEHSDALFASADGVQFDRNAQT